MATKLAMLVTYKNNFARESLLQVSQVGAHET